MKSVQVRCYFLFSPNTGKFGPEITPYLNTFQAVLTVETQIDAHEVGSFYLLFTSSTNMFPR